MGTVLPRMGTVPRRSKRDDFSSATRDVKAVNTGVDVATVVREVFAQGREVGAAEANRTSAPNDDGPSPAYLSMSGRTSAAALANQRRQHAQSS